MHAASVHPEPGSNSRMFILYPALAGYNLLSELFILASFTFRVYILVIDEICISHLLMLCTSLFVVQFSMTVSPSLSDSLTIIPHHFTLVNTFFKTFLSFFIFGVFRQTMQQFDILSLSFCITKLRYYFLYKDE